MKNENSIRFIVLLSTCFTGLNGVYVKSTRGACPDVITKQDFKIDEYLGVWYDIARFPFMEGVTCGRASYSPKSSNSINVFNDGLLPGGELTTVSGIAVQGDPSEPGRLSVTFETSPVAALYLVLDTDYSSYSAVYSCTSFSVFKVELAWILSRNNTVEDDVNAKAMAAFANFGIDTTKFIKTLHENCQY